MTLVRATLRDWILGSLEPVRDGRMEIGMTAAPDAPLPGCNEFLFLLKPELVLASRFDLALDSVLERIEASGFTAGQVRLFSGAYLARQDLMAAHYGAINRLCRAAKANLSDEARARFQEVFGVAAEDATVWGAFEYLQAHPQLTAESLSDLWLGQPYTKLAGGTYCVQLNGCTPAEYLINGFHPKQLSHFTAPGRVMVAMPLSGDMPWKTARNDFLGATDPAHARAGSLRRVLYERREEWGMDLLRGGMNGIHLSAGPLEGLVELRRFGSGPSTSEGVRSITDFSFGERLTKYFTPARIEWMLGNPDVQWDGKRMSLFDLTEELDPGEAVERLKRIP